ncbi:unnamed protein product, partial [Hermetia illucens]
IPYQVVDAFVEGGYNLLDPIIILHNSRMLNRLLMVIRESRQHKQLACVCIAHFIKVISPFNRLSQHHEWSREYL